MTSLEPTSRDAILPSGETLDLVRPGMSRVVGRMRGVEAALLFRVSALGRLVRSASADGASGTDPDPFGLPGCDGAGVSLNATPTPSFEVA